MMKRERYTLKSGKNLIGGDLMSIIFGVVSAVCLIAGVIVLNVRK